MTQAYPELIGFSLVSSLTPGPNNLMLLASAMNFGLRRSLPHMLGVGVGFPLLLLAIGAGLGRALDLLPGLGPVLKAGSLLFVLWLAWRIARGGPVAAGDDLPGADPPGNDPPGNDPPGNDPPGNDPPGRPGARSAPRPLTFIQAVLFQWINPKAWALALVVHTAFRFPGDVLPGFVTVSVIFSLASLPAIALWSGAGSLVRRLLADPVWLRRCNIAMAVLLVASFVHVIVPGDR